MLSQPPATVTHLDKVIEYIASNPVEPEARAAALLKLQTHVCTNYYFTNEWGKTYRNEYIAKNIEQILRGARCMVAWALQNMQYDTSQWIIHYTQPQFKLFRVIANKMAALGFSCENMALVNDASMKRPFGNPESKKNDLLFYPASGPINPAQFYGSKKLSLSGKIQPLQKLDSQTKIIIPLNYHLKSDLKKSYPTVLKNYLHILETQGLSRTQVTLFFGMFDGMDSNAPDTTAHIEFYRQHEANFLEEVVGLNIMIKRFSDLSKTIYYSLADEIISNMLIDHSDLIKEIIAADVITYTTEAGYICHWNFKVHPLADQRVYSESDIGGAFSNISNDPKQVLLNMELALFRKLEKVGRDSNLIDHYAKFAGYLILNFGLQNIDWTFVAMVRERMNNLSTRMDLSPAQQDKVRIIYQEFLNQYLTQTYLLTSRITARPISAASDDKKTDSEDEKANIERTVATTETDTPVIPQRGITLFTPPTRSTPSNFIEGSMLENIYKDIFIKISPPNVQTRKVVAGLKELENKYNSSVRP